MPAAPWQDPTDLSRKLSFLKRGVIAAVLFASAGLFLTVLYSWPVGLGVGSIGAVLWAGLAVWWRIVTRRARRDQG